MRRILMFIMVIAFVKTYSQNYKINFAGTGASSDVSSVYVENLTQCTNLTLNGSDILNLNGTDGINNISPLSENYLLVSPNPMSDFCLIEFESPAQDDATIELFDIAGKSISKLKEILSKGKHTFRLSGTGSGIYILRVESDKYFYTARIISSRETSGSAELKHIETTHHFNEAITSGDNGSLNRLTGNKSLINMQYTPGDILRLTGISGNYRTVSMLVPNQSQAVTFNFVACTDGNNNSYAVIQINNQLWMAQNLNAGTRVNGADEQTDNGVMEKYCYNDDEDNCIIYGGLYQWDEMMQYVTTEKTRGICPAGWHLPSDGEVTVLTDYLGGLDYASGRMKEVCTDYWEIPNEGATDESGFAVLPGGMRYMNGTFRDRTRYFDWWTSTEEASYSAWYRDIGFSNTKVHTASYYKTNGFSVRCIRD